MNYADPFTSTENDLFEYFASKAPFSLIPSDALRLLVSNSTFRKFDPGQRILRPDEVNPYIYFVLREMFVFFLILRMVHKLLQFSLVIRCMVGSVF